jgi:NAD(P)-dependent dehydrogenase (short-subunit alcohol dehydrogenase family)
VQLDPVHERVLVDRPRVGGALAQRLAVGLAGPPTSAAVIAANGTSSIASISIRPGPTRYRPPSLTCCRFHSRTVNVMSPANTSLRNSRLNCTPGTLARDVRARLPRLPAYPLVAVPSVRARRVAVMDLELTDKVAVVTGASKGIGLAVVRELAREGALVVAGARSTETLEGLDGVTAFAVDLLDPDGPGRLVAHAINLHGRVDVLVNNVGGVHPRVDGFLHITDADFEASLQLNFFAALRATRAALADMLERREGTIVNVASVNAFFEPDGAVVDYGAAKAALLNVAKALSQELGPKGIRINSVSPGPVATDLWLGDDGVAATIGRATGADPDAIRTQVIDQGIPTGRFSTPEEVATLVALLASPRTTNVTGSDFIIDGGLIKTM